MEFLVNNTLRLIPDEELTFTLSKSSGPGGQHVNKTNSKVTLYWNIDDTRSFTTEEIKRIKRSLVNIINKEGYIYLSDESHRSQLRNKVNCKEKLANYISEALKIIKKRKPTRISRSKKIKRAESNKRHSEIKANRKKIKI